MAGTYIALKPDSTMPIFINPGNPAAYALIRLTTLEVGGKFTYSRFFSKAPTLEKWSTNFSYGALGFPVGGRGGACLGIMPYSDVGYDTEEKRTESVGEMRYLYSGSGGISKAYLGYGIMPFNRLNLRFRRKYAQVNDSSAPLSNHAYNRRNFATQMLSDLALGFNVNYLFGNIQHTARSVYPNPNLHNNTYRERVLTLGDFTGNAGLQTAISIDSVRAGKGLRRRLKQRVKITMGYIMTINNPLNVTDNLVAYNYIQNAAGEELIRDTVIFNIDRQRKFTLPVEQGFGIGFKKGERLNLVTDLAITDWSNFNFMDEISDLTRNYRVSAGINFVPEKYASGNGAFFRKLNYRFGVSYQTGYIRVRNTTISDYFVSAGIGLPVGIGRLSSMVQVSVQYGQLGTLTNGLLKENYFRVNFGFTFCDRWFQKIRYD
jgi:hypothetical protein